MTYKVPERSGEVLITPPLDRIPELLAAGRARPWGGARILGTPLEEFRLRLRHRALAIAGPHVRGPRPEPGAPLVLMGHQPLFFHPGVWVKFFLLTRLHQDLGACTLHLLVDSDASGPIQAPIPAWTDQLTRRTETLLGYAPELKRLNDGNIERAWGGIASLQFGLPIIWSEGRLSLERIAQLMCQGPAAIAGIAKGKIAAGYDADLVVWSPEQRFRVTPEIDFRADRSMEHAARIQALLRRLNDDATS